MRALERRAFPFLSVGSIVFLSFCVYRCLLPATAWSPGVGRSREKFLAPAGEAGASVSGTSCASSRLRLLQRDLALDKSQYVDVTNHHDALLASRSDEPVQL